MNAHETGKIIYSLLTADAAVAAVIGTRCEPLLIYQGNAYPAVCYDIVSVNPSPTKTGASQYDAVRVEVLSIAESYTAAVALAGKVRTALERISPQSVAGIALKAVFYDTERHLNSQATGFEGAFTISQDFIVHLS